MRSVPNFPILDSILNKKKRKKDGNLQWFRSQKLEKSKHDEDNRNFMKNKEF
jgi:hypothetical protein